ncbi:hypothetical protein [Yokenella regensburgei]|uniref:hypothetical protein n=1 Tax=Yokenella regensburgei TaxID=158877 RepID=UPI003EDA16E0
MNNATAAAPDEETYQVFKNAHFDFKPQVWLSETFRPGGAFEDENLTGHVNMKRNHSYEE